MFLGAVARRALAASLFFLMVPHLINAGTTAPPAKQQSAVSTPTTSPRVNLTKSDRDRAGLRGPVEECSEETIYPPSDPDGHFFRVAATDKYYSDGRIYQHIDFTGLNPGTESFTYDAEGRLLAEDRDGAPEIISAYDALGRLVSITGEQDPAETTTFEYDDKGRKTRIVKSDVKPSPSSTIYINGSFDDDLSVDPPDGGLVKTLFNEHDQAVESQVYDANGRLWRRLRFVYDSKGRVAEYMVLDLREPTPEAMTSEVETSIYFYVYDDKNRVIEKRDYEEWSRQTTVTKIIYNNHGDEMEEIATTYDDLNPPQKSESGDGDEPSSDASDLPSATPESHILRFNYEYDSFGNWIDLTVTSPTGAHHSPGIWGVTNRTITYY